MSAALSWDLEFLWLVIVVAALFVVVLRRTGSRRNAAVLAVSVAIAFVAGALLHPAERGPVTAQEAAASGATVVAGAPVTVTKPVDPLIWKDALSDPSVENHIKIGGGVEGSLVIQNTSPATWSVHTSPAITGGFHWIDSKGTVLSEGRFDLGKDFKPGEKRRVAFIAAAPLKPGNYSLNIDLLCETIDWFGNHGNHTVTVKVNVAA